MCTVSQELNKPIMLSVPSIIAEEKELKFVVVGDEQSGKTSLISSCLGLPFSETRPTQLIDFQRLSIKKGNKILRLKFV